MNRHDNTLRRRILYRPSIKLIERDGYVLIGPDFPVTIRKLTVLAFAVEAVVFPILVLAAGLWWWFFSYQLTTLIILVIVYGMLQTAFAVGLATYLHRKMKHQTRFVLHPEGDITVKDGQFRDHLLEHGPDFRFVCLPATDRHGRPLFDLSLEHNRKTYYLISGFDGDEMRKLCDDLKRACGGSS